MSCRSCRRCTPHILCPSCMAFLDRTTDLAVTGLKVTHWTEDLVWSSRPDWRESVPNRPNQGIRP